ncbi:hypothetical protein pipiens_003699 [Culex pipiens pipiens]|uniref:AB hydrolase-1 domain-containing protein n=1 Tax=Culex pipiens pipiens TaxID=38569 RepID=A0ABD1CU42_CULPP
MMLRVISVLRKSINSVTPFQQRSFSIQNVEEVRIPVPCGTIAAKWWGPKDVRPIVSVHGWQDNSGSFDRLIPLLPDHMSFLAIDLPGHGLSSRYPAGTAYHTLDYVTLLESIRQRFNWDQMSLLGHSRGAVINFAYSAIFPNKVNLNVALDPIKPHIAYPTKVALTLARRIPKLLEADAYNTQGTEPPSYTYGELIEHLYIGSGKSVSKEAASCLLKRNITESKLHPGKFYFTRDNRLKYLFQAGLGWSPEVCLELAKRLTMPHLCFKINRSDDWLYHGEPFYRTYFELVAGGNPNFEGHFLDGTHHVHLCEPEKHRSFSVQNMIAPPKVEEVRIPVPCGTIAAKWWGPKDVRPIVSVHGWQDNSGTFDRLIPLLPDHMSFLAIDLPGHGLSSRYPTGMAYHTVDIVTLLESIRKWYNWDQMSLMGHSRGAVINFAYSAIFPEKVNLNVAIDPIKPFIGNPAEVATRIATMIPKFLQADAYSTQGTEPPSNTYEELIDRLHIGTDKSVSREAAPYLLKRNMAESKLHPGKYYFTRDNRLKHLFQVGLGWSPEVCLELAKRLTMPHLCFKMNRSDDWIYYGGDFYQEYFELVGSGNPNFEGHFLDGPHHVHLSEPEKVAPMIGRFLDKHWKKLPTSVLVGEVS